MAERLIPNQDIEQNSETQINDIVWEDVPTKRKRWRTRLASFVICSCTAIGIIIYGFVKSKTIEYKSVSDLSPTKLEAIKNGSIIIYTREEKESYTVFLNLGLGLLAIILGTFVDRLSLIFEELFHFKSRYNKSTWNMLKACFSGISLGAVFGVALIVIISIAIALAKKSTFELRYLTYILSGIGVGPLVMHLLNLNTQSEVHISTILEEKETYIANGLAWSYYFNYLAKALPKFRERFPDDSSTSVQQGTQTRLSLNKLILLISHDCDTVDNLANQDNHITKETEIDDDIYKFPVYKFPYNGKTYSFVIKYVRQPLETLQKMSQYERIKALREKQRDYQVKLLCRTLSEIVKDPLHKECKGKCILVPIKAKFNESLQNGGLVNAIMHKVNADKCTPEHVDGFIVVPPIPKTKQPRATEDDTTDLDGKIVDLPPSNNIKINLVDERVQYSKAKEDYPSYTNNQDEEKAKSYPSEEQANRLDRGKEPVSGERTYKGKSCPNERKPLMLPNNHETSIHVDDEARESKGAKGQAQMDNTQVTTSNDPKKSGGTGETDNLLVSSKLINTEGEGYGRRPALSDGQSISRHTHVTVSHQASNNSENGEGNSPREDGYEGSAFMADSTLRSLETENQSTSSHLVDRAENRLREEVGNERPPPSYNPPVSDHTGENGNQPMSAYVDDGGENSHGGEEDTTPMSSTSMGGRPEL